MSTLNSQEGGSHYRKLAIQPVEYVHRNGLGFIEGSVVKYVTRWRDKGGIGDLRKARHLLEILIELETNADLWWSTGVVAPSSPEPVETEDDGS